MVEQPFHPVALELVERVGKRERDVGLDARRRKQDGGGAAKNGEGLAGSRRSQGAHQSFAALHADLPVVHEHDAITGGGLMGRRRSCAWDFRR